MNKGKLSKFLAVVLVFAMTLTLMPAAVAFAEDTATWEKVALADISESDTIAISMLKGSTYYFLPNAATTKQPSATGLTEDNVTVGNLSPNSYGWTISKNGESLTISSGSNYLYKKGDAATDLCVGGTSATWTVDGDYLKLEGTNGRPYAGVRVASTDWRCYADKSGSGNISGETLQFWRLSDSSTPTHEHEWGDWTSNNDGTHSRTCAGEDCPVGTQTENCSFDEGTVTTQPTCVDAGVKELTCTVCGYTKTEAIPATGEHVDADNDGACDVCGEAMPTATVFTLGTELHEGDQVVIYSVSGSVALSVNPSGNKLAGTAASIEGEELTVLSNDENTAVLTVEFDDALNFRLKTASGKYLTSGATGNSLSFSDEANEYSLWYLAVVDSSTVLIKNTNAKYSNKIQALEYYNNLFTTYSEGTGKAFQLQLYIYANPNAHVHEWDEGTVTTEPTCTSKGVKTFACSGCDETYTEEIPMIAHVDEDGDGHCDTCKGTIYTAATTLNDGDRVIVVFDAESKAMTSTASGTKMAPADVNAQAGVTVPVAENNIWKVQTADEGFYLVSSEGKYLTSGETGSSLTLEDEANDYSLWSLEVVDAEAKIVFVRSVNAAYNEKKNQAVEFYNGTFSTYGTKENDANEAFKLVLYTLPAEKESIADGFYLIGQKGWTVDAIDPEQKFEENENAKGEYLLNTTLAVGDEIKVVRVENNAITGWWPGGTGNNYTVDEAHSGNVTIYFKTDKVDDWAEFGGYFYIGSLLKPTLSADIYGCSLSLKGNIALNFYVIPSEELMADEGAYVALGDGDTQFKFSEASTRVVGEDTLYQFNVSLHAKQMNDVVTLRAYDGKGNAVALYRHSNNEELTETGFAYSVQDYFKAARESGDAKLIALVNAMSDYGSLAQVQFNYNTDTRVDVQADLSTVTAEDLTKFEAKITKGKATGVTYYGTSLLLQSKTMLRVYFTLDEGEIGDYTFKLGKKTLTPDEKDGKWYVDLASVSAKDLDKTYTLTVTGAEGTVVTVKTNALSYAYSVLSNSDDATLLDLVKGLYLYNQAANDYFGK